MGNIIMSKKESQQIDIMEQLKRHEITQKSASLILDYSIRQIRRKIKHYIMDGAKSLIHKNRGRKSGRRWKKENKAIEIIQHDYHDFGPTFAAEKLQENHGISVSKETLRKAMIKAGIWCIKRRKFKHRQYRERKHYQGELIQFDGSNHDWFEGRGPKCDLLVFVDDATGIVYAEFAPESTLGVMEVMRNYFMKYGLPVSFYVDHNSVYKVNLNNPENEKKSQVERALSELNIKMDYANSPQAKGRVERSNKTHQDRLIKELRLAGISTIKEANKFLKEVYLPRHNAKFAIAPTRKENLHRPVFGYNLYEILCIKEKRILKNDFTIQHKKLLFQLERQNTAMLRPKDIIFVHTQLDGNIFLTCRNFKLRYHKIEQKIALTKIVSNKYYKPSQNHPWRNINHQINIIK